MIMDDGALGSWSAQHVTVLGIARRFDAARLVFQTLQLKVKSVLLAGVPELSRTSRWLHLVALTAGFLTQIADCSRLFSIR